MPEPQSGVQQLKTGENGEGGDMRDEALSGEPSPYWGDGRLVYRRPESRNSEIAARNIISSDKESAQLTQALAHRVMSRRARSAAERSADIGKLVARQEQERAEREEGDSDTA